MSPALRHKSRRGDSGFTLIEVLIALALVAISLTAIGALVGTTTRGTRSLEQHVALVETARSVASSIPPNAELVRTDLAGETRGYPWRIDVLPYTGGGIVPVEESGWIPRTVKIRVQSPTGAILSIETVRLQRNPKQ